LVDISGHRQTISSSSLTLLPGEKFPTTWISGTRKILSTASGASTVPLGNATIDSKITTDWSISVSGRLGWLASASTLLYVLGAYTHQ
jgi:hypothetical protein